MRCWRGCLSSAVASGLDGVDESLLSFPSPYFLSSSESCEGEAYDASGVVEGVSFESGHDFGEGSGFYSSPIGG